MLTAGTGTWARTPLAPGPGCPETIKMRWAIRLAIGFRLDEEDGVTLAAKKIRQRPCKARTTLSKEQARHHFTTSSHGTITTAVFKYLWSNCWLTVPLSPVGHMIWQLRRRHLRIILSPVLKVTLTIRMRMNTVATIDPLDPNEERLVLVRLTNGHNFVLPKVCVKIQIPGRQPGAN